MSKEALAKVVQRAISDASFRRQLNSDTAGALRGFDLTADEVSALRTGDAGRLSTLGVDQRMSKSFVLGGALAATKMAQTVIPNDAGAALTADDAGGASTRSTSVRTGDDWKFADRASQGSVAPVEGSPEATAAELGRGASGAGSDAAARLARLDETFNGGSTTVDASGAGSEAAARLARLDETFNGGSTTVDASGGMANYPAHDGLAGPSAVGSARAGDDWARAGIARIDDSDRIGAARLDDASGGSTTAFINDSEGYLTPGANDPEAGAAQKATWSGDENAGPASGADDDDGATHNATEGGPV